MEKLKLRDYNEEAYRKVSELFKTENRACIEHATGTGKTYVTARVVQDYNKSRVLVIAPTLELIEQNKNIIGDDCNYATYYSLHNFNKRKNAYDLICLDEMHRAGAKTWQRKVEKLFESNPEAKIFGATATNIRYLDGERDMSSELFNGNTVSSIPIHVAWERGIYLPPIYVLGSTNFDIELNEAAKEMKGTEFEEEIKKMKINWEKSLGISGIFKQFIRKDTKRIIVFNDRINTNDELKDLLDGWLHNAGFTGYKFYKIDSSMDKEKSVMEFKKFSADDENGMKIMIAVNKLNEGIHVPSCDTVIMFRSTTSKNIFIQQCGRCMSTDHLKKPVIIDLVDNINREGFIMEFSGCDSEFPEERNLNPNWVEFQGLALRFKELLGKFSDMYKSNLQKLFDIWNTEHRNPNHSIKEEDKIYQFMWREIKRGNQKVIDNYNTYCKVRISHTVDELLNFCNTYGRLPNWEENVGLYQFMWKEIKKGNQKAISIYKAMKEII